MKSSGFSLVELSIVLVILGLLTGGILAGQSLIRASELRAISTEYERYKTASLTFRDKYFALPGDMNNATLFWLTATNCPGTNAQPSTTAATCDGNADGRINIPTTSNEFYRFYQHLANAGLIEGTYTGVTGAGDASNHRVIGQNVPRSRLANAGWSVEFFGDILAANATFFEGSYGNVFTFGAQTSNWSTLNPVIRPEEAWNIDTKMDDSRPGLGSIRVFESGTCTNSPVQNTAQYALTNSAVVCSLLFLNVF